MADSNGSDWLATRQKNSPSPIEKMLSRIFLLFEDIIKVSLFHCQRCGECILSHTAFVCSQRCPE